MLCLVKGAVLLPQMHRGVSASPSATSTASMTRLRRRRYRVVTPCHPPKGAEPASGRPAWRAIDPRSLKTWSSSGPLLRYVYEHRDSGGMPNGLSSALRRIALGEAGKEVLTGARIPLGSHRRKFFGTDFSVHTVACAEWGDWIHAEVFQRVTSATEAFPRRVGPPELSRYDLFHGHLIRSPDPVNCDDAYCTILLHAREYPARVPVFDYDLGRFQRGSTVGSGLDAGAHRRMMDTRNILWTVSFSPLEQTSCTVRNMSLAVIDVSYQNELDDPLVSPTVEPFGTIDDSLFGHSVCSVFCLKNEDAVEGGAGVFIV